MYYRRGELETMPFLFIYRISLRPSILSKMLIC